MRSVGSAFPDQVRPEPDNERLLQSLRGRGMSLPGELVEWFTWFGHQDPPTGPTAAWLAPGLECHALPRAIELNHWWSQEMGYDKFAAGWLPIADYQHGASIVVNCTSEYGTGVNATTTSVSDMAELQPKTRWVPSLTTVLSWWTDRIETGGWTYAAEQGWRNHVDPSIRDRYATGLIS